MKKRKKIYKAEDGWVIAKPSLQLMCLKLDEHLEDLERAAFFSDPYKWKYPVKNVDFLGQVLKNVRA